MLEYVKFILGKVSFDGTLFEKELKKNIKNLIEEECQELKAWCFQEFGNKHHEVLKRCFIG